MAIDDPAPSGSDAAQAEGESLADVMAEVARTLHAPPDLAATLEQIVTTAVDSLPGLDHAGVSVGHHSGDVETLAATDPLVSELDRLQYSLGEGPCVFSLEVQPLTVVEDLPSESRWPRYIPQAARLGVRAQLAVRLYLEEQTLGVLNLYSTSTDEVHDDVVHAAELFATHAALALGKARVAHNLSEALDTRTVIGQATGLVMERYQLDDHVAFEYLVRVSTTSNRKLRDIAQEVIDQANVRYHRGG